VLRDHSDLGVDRPFRASTRAFISGQKTRPAAVFVESNSRFHCYRNPFYRDLLGFEVTCRYPGGSFFGAGGYHHQLAANTWNSRGAGPRPDRMAGLDGLELVVRDAAARGAIEQRAREAGLRREPDGDGTMLRDPWGTAITLVSG
jgi:catechol-2,3-dioxygenase